MMHRTLYVCRAEVIVIEPGKTYTFTAESITPGAVFYVRLRRAKGRRDRRVSVGGTGKIDDQRESGGEGVRRITSVLSLPLPANSYPVSISSHRSNCPSGPFPAWP